MEANQPAKPTAAVRIEPTGPRAKTPRDYLVTIEIELSTAAPKFADKAELMAAAHRACAIFAPHDGAPDRRSFEESMSSRRPAKTGGMVSVVTGVSAAIACEGRPTLDEIERLRASLHEDGYRVSAIEERTCSEDGCMSVALLDWSRPTAIPATWYSDQTCGRHNYKTCPSCASVFVLRSSNAAGQGPSLHCSVCGSILVEWGGSKIWEADARLERPT